MPSMPDFADLACILLAAGEGRRFGGRKLEARLKDKMLGLHAAELLAGMSFGALVAVCNAANEALNAELAALGFRIVINPEPSAGQARSLALGIGAVAEGQADAALVALADMPHVSAEHLRALVGAFERGGRIVPGCSAAGAVKLPPAIFPRSCWAELCNLSGDQGARGMLADAITVPADAATLKDIDRPQDMK